MGKGYDWGGFLQTDPLGDDPVLVPSVFGRQLLAVDDATGALNLIGAEAALGNPLVDGYRLTSTAAGVRSWVAPAEGLPSQTGHSGKFLTTNGTAASWATVTTPAWGAITGTLSSQTDLQSALDAKQASDADLTAIAALTASNDDILQRKAGAWTNRTLAQIKTDLSLSGSNTGDQDLSLYQTKAGVLALGGFSSITGRVGNANLPLSAQLYDSAGTPKLSVDVGARKIYFNTIPTPAIDWSDGSSVFVHSLRSTVPDNPEYGTFINQEAITTTVANGDATFRASGDLTHGIGAQKISELVGQEYGRLIIDVQDRLLFAYDSGDEVDVLMLDWADPTKIKFFNGASYVTDAGIFTGNGSGLTGLVGDDTAYDATSWNANTGVATKNAIRDKFETLRIGTDIQAYDADLTTWAGITPGTGVGSALALNVGSAGAFQVNNGSGASLTSLNATQLTSGTVPPVRLSLTLAELNTAISDADVPGLATANTFTLNQINSYSGTASTPAMKYSGVPFAGTGTTSFPLVYINDANATASTTLNTAGTYFGVNGDGTQDLMNLLKDGTSLFKVDSTGNFILNGMQISSAAGTGAQKRTRFWNNALGATTDIYGTGLIESSSSVTLGPAGSTFSYIFQSTGLMQFGGTSSSSPGLKRNAATIDARLADDSGYAAVQTLYDRFGSGSPESVVTAPVGAVYHRTDGGAVTSFYVKESGAGNTGWIAK